MANFDQLKQSVAALIRTNGAEEITGQIMQDVLLTIINSISGGYMFGGVAQHNGNVGNPDYNVFYLAGSGAYTGYGGAITIEDGCYGVFRYNGTWTQEVVDIGVRLSGSIVQGETRGVTGDTINTALQQLFNNVMDILDTLTFTYNTPSAQQATKAMLDVIMTPTGGASHVFATLTLASATVAAAGLMSAEDKQKVDRMLTDFRSLSLTDTTAAADEATKIVQTLSATLGENPEAITTMTFLAATASKAGLMSAADKAYIDGLPTALTSLSNSIMAEIQSIIDNYAECLAAQENGDLYLTDENGNAIAVFEGGHIKTKNFDSSDIETNSDLSLSDYDNGDFGISDHLGNVIIKLSGGNISVKNFTSSPLQGKKCSFLGDSITTYSNYPGSNVPFYNGNNAGVTSVDKTWWKSLCDRQGATVNRIYAYGGGNVVNRLCLQYDNLYSNGTSGDLPDVVFILAGINDWYHGVALGTIADEENSNTTFYAAYKYLLKNLKETYPNAQIIGLTMLNSMIKGTTIPYLNNNNVSIRDFCKAVVECCDYYSVPSIDLNKIVNINGGNYTELLADYTHPNITGIGMMTKAIINNIHNVIYY